MRRRDLLVLGGAVAVALAIPPILRRQKPDFEFVQISGMPGFRRLERGSISAAPDLFAGLRTSEEVAADGRLSSSLCAAVFPDDTPRDKIPVVVFSDYYCPYCAVLDKRLADLESAGAPITVRFRELPMLGDRSRWAAQVALAAERQVDHTTIHLDMMQRVLKPGIAGVREVARRHDLDADQLMTDASSEEMQQQIEDAMALGRALGIPGTPGTFVGRTLVIGALSEHELMRLVDLEMETPLPKCLGSR